MSDGPDAPSPEAAEIHNPDKQPHPGMIWNEIRHSWIFPRTREDIDAQIAEGRGDDEELA